MGPTFGEKLQQLREKKGLTQYQASELSGIPLWSLRNYEQNRRDPSWKVALRLANALGVKVEDFADCLAAEEVETGAVAAPSHRKARKPTKAEKAVPATAGKKGKKADKGKQ